MIRIAIIGAGPSGLFVMDQLLREDNSLHIDLFDKLPSPYGLLRTGVAPDHQTIKNLQAYYEKIFDRFPNQIHFYGNINVGKDVSVEELKPFYTALFMCTGSESDRPLAIPGHDLPGVIPSRHMVRWYNSHPLYDLHPTTLDKQTAAIIGVGNVSIDIARILLKPVEELEQTDISEKSLRILKKSNIDHVHMFARRSPVQAAFTAKEFKELVNLPNLKVNVNLQNNSLSSTDLEELEYSSKARSNLDIMSTLESREDNSYSKQLTIHFYSQPVEFIGKNSLESIRFEQTSLTGPANAQKAVGSGQFYTIDSDYAFISIGYVGIRVPGIPFDEKQYVIPHEEGKVLNKNKSMNGFYTAGWIKRGAQGVVGTNRADAKETVTSFFNDLPKLDPLTNKLTIDSLLKAKMCKWINYTEWLKINKHEIEEGKKNNCVRVKFRSSDEIFNFLHK